MGALLLVHFPGVGYLQGSRARLSLEGGNFLLCPQTHLAQAVRPLPVP